MTPFSARTLVLASALALTTGCGANPEPKPLPPPSAGGSITPPPSTPTSSPSGSPSIPAAARQHTDAGAKAFFESYVDVQNRSIHGSTAELRSLHSASCKSCQAIERGIESVYRHGGTITGMGWSVGAIRKSRQTRADSVVYESAIRISQQTVVARRSATPKVYRGGKARLLLALAWGEGRWSVVDLKVLQ